MPTRQDRPVDAAVCDDEGHGGAQNPSGRTPDSHRNALAEPLTQLAEDNSTLRGMQFESIVRFWLQADPVYAPQVARIWRWEQWPGADGPDLGVDLVVETVTGALWAVQCKGYHRPPRPHRRRPTRRRARHLTDADRRVTSTPDFHGDRLLHHARGRDRQDN
ncbi:hypothetical protein [Micromonospora kangleipakensis]|nr:hypothetical protein [Micromonospora kangleipakensis]